MRKVVLSGLFFIFIKWAFLPMDFVFAEPWLSNRYAQNCSACHAPGRWNLNPSERRCTLSCQGCHVNPNGGGIRNQYGVWNQQRWLRSFYSDTLRNKRTPAPLKEQKYKNKTNDEDSNKEEKNDREVATNRREKRNAKIAKMTRRKPSNTSVNTSSAVGEEGVPRMVSTTNLSPRNADYDRSDYHEWKTNVDRATFLTTIPYDDPYRVERREWIYAGGDIRYIFGNLKESDEQTNLNFPMAVDMGLRFRPTREKLSLVLENRFFNTPSNKSLEQAFTTSSQVRSAYLIVDDIWYNTWMMAGLYRPMFGNYVPDHNSLSQTMAFGSSSYRIVYKAVGVGGSPNVPYANIHFIAPMLSSSFSQDTGVVANVGARAVTKSLSTNFSFWNTTNDSTGKKLIKQMMAVSGGGMIGRLVLNGEWLRVDEEFAPGRKNGGNVISFDSKFRIWRENYTSLGYAYSNVSRSSRLGKGKSSELYVGAKSFLYSGMELELLFIDRPNEFEGVKTKENLIQLQAHLFF